MQRIFSILVLLFVAGLPAVAEEVALKDGTKIVGHMSGVTADKVEIETAYGKLQLKRSDIVTISFPENAPKSADATAAKTEAPKMDESLQGAHYLNKTAKFSLTLPQEWVIDPDVRRAPETLTVLSSRDKTRFLMVMQEEYPGSLESYKEMVALNSRSKLSNYEELAQSNVTIDGKKALFLFYRGTSPKGGLPLAFLSGIIPSGNTYTKITVWCVEPLFHDMQPTFEKMLMSYRTTGAMTAAGTSSRP
jgi:PsbP-like protein